VFEGESGSNLIKESWSSGSDLNGWSVFEGEAGSDRLEESWSSGSDLIEEGRSSGSDLIEGCDCSVG